MIAVQVSAEPVMVFADDPHAVPRRQPVTQRLDDLAAPAAEPTGQFLGRLVERGHVVLPAVEEVADLVVRAAAGDQVAVADHLGELLVGLPEPAVEVDHGLGHVGQLGRELGQVVQAGPGRQRLAQVGDQPRGVVRCEERGVDAEHLGDPHQHRHGQRPGVVLDLVEVAG